MQLKMENRKKNLLEYLQKEENYITYLLEAFEVPETVESEWNYKFLNFWKYYLNFHSKNF